MTTCQTINDPIMSVLLSSAINVVSTPPGARTWSAPRGKISIYKVENTSHTIPEQAIKD